MRVRRRRRARGRRLRSAGRRRGLLRAGRARGGQRSRMRVPLVQRDRAPRRSHGRVRAESVAAARRRDRVRGRDDADRRRRAVRLRAPGRDLPPRYEVSRRCERRCERGRRRRRRRLRRRPGVPGRDVERRKLLPAGGHERRPLGHAGRRGRVGGAGARHRWRARLPVALPAPRSAPGRVRRRCARSARRQREGARDRERCERNARRTRRRDLRGSPAHPYFRVGDIPRRRHLTPPHRGRRPRPRRSGSRAARGRRHFERCEHALRALARPRRRGQRGSGRARSDLHARTVALRVGRRNSTHRGAPVLP